MSKEYGKVMDDYYTQAEKQGKVSNNPIDAWIRIDPGQLWCPNPHYSGPAVKYPEEKTN